MKEQTNVGYCALDNAEAYRARALQDRNNGRGSAVRVLPTSAWDMPTGETRALHETRYRYRAEIAEALEAFRFDCFPERYELRF
jgi:hypothetical protein